MLILHLMATLQNFKNFNAFNEVCEIILLMLVYQESFFMQSLQKQSRALHYSSSVLMSDLFEFVINVFVYAVAFLQKGNRAQSQCT